MELNQKDWTMAKEESNNEQIEQAVNDVLHQWNVSFTTSERKKFHSRIRRCQQPPLVVLDTLRNYSLFQLSETMGFMSTSHRKQMLLRHAILLAQVLSNTVLPSWQEMLCQSLNVTASSQRNRLLVRNSNKKVTWSRSGIKRFLNVMRQHFTIDDIRHMVLKAPLLLDYGTDKLQTTLDYFYNGLGLAPREVTAMLRTCPRLVSYSVQQKLRPAVQFIQTELSETEWKRIVVKYPQVLQISLPKLQEQLTCLEQQILHPPPSEVASARDRQQQQLQSPQQQNHHAAAPFGVRHMCALYPPLLWLSPSLLQTKVQFFQMPEYLDMNTTELQIMITSFPQVLGLSVERNLRPKVMFLLTQMPAGTLKEWICYQPSLLAYSLTNRIQPRVAMLQQHDIALCYSPPYLMSFPDTKFLAWYATCVCAFFIWKRLIQNLMQRFSFCLSLFRLQGGYAPNDVDYYKPITKTSSSK
jgi:hypothetical protein